MALNPAPSWFSSLGCCPEISWYFLVVHSHFLLASPLFPLLRVCFAVSESDIFDVVEDLDNKEALTMLYHIFRSLVMLNDSNLIDTLFSSDNIGPTPQE